MDIVSGFVRRFGRRLSAGMALVFMTGSLYAGKEESASFYAPNTVQSLRIEIADNHQKAMLAALPDRIYVPATLRWRETVVENVGIRFKGNSSSNPRQSHKRGYLIKVNEYDKGRRFLGLRRISLDNGVQFGGLYSEILITDVLRDLGLPASRCNYARLFLNDDYQGVYVNVERIDESFMDHSLEGADGLLYKAEGGPGVNLAYAGPNLDVYKRGFEPKSKAAERNFRALERFLAVIGDENPENVGRETLEKVLELEAFMQTMAVLLFSGAFDQATGWGPHNYYFYRPAEGGPWRYLTWDLDVGFADGAFGHVAVIDRWHAAWPLPGGGPPRPLLETILSRPELLQRYRKTAKRILESHFLPERLQKQIEDLYSLVKPHLELDPFPPGRITVPTDQTHRDVIESMVAFFERRYRLAQKQLENPGERPLYTRIEHRQDQERRRRENEPHPGDRQGSPTELQIVSREAGAVRLRWRNKAPRAAMHVIQRADGIDGQFRNHIGDPAPGLEEIVDPKIEDNKVYRYRVYAVFPSPQGPQGTQVSNEVISIPQGS